MTINSKISDLKKEKEKDETFEVQKFISEKKIVRALNRAQIYKLRRIQKEAIEKGLFFRKSFLVCAPSGSGKTLIGELGAIYNIIQGLGKSIYLVPFKALATEKYNHFKKIYGILNIKIELSIGDQEPDEKQLQYSDLIITTYEKMDSILRNFKDKKWIFNITTIIIDEIHVIGETDRGPRLESLIVRLNQFLKYPQIIGLSATIANPETFQEWLSSLGNETILIYSEERPVPLHYKIKIANNKDVLIRKIIKSTLNDGGQVLIFVNKRKTTQSLAINLKNLVKSYLSKKDREILEKILNILNILKGGMIELRKIIKDGIAFHHAGLLYKERKIIEDAFKKRILKVLICTTTLSAGINMPARVVILRDFKKYTTFGANIRNFQDFHESPDGYSFFKPFSANEVFQMLGRAGRPNLDDVGYGIILVKNVQEEKWVLNYYFKSMSKLNKLIPKYNKLKSGLNSINTLKEQVLLRIYEQGKISLEQLREFFRSTYFWFLISKKNEEMNIPIEQFLMIREIEPENLLKLHGYPERLKKISKINSQTRITKISEDTISGYVKTNYGVYFTEFNVTRGISCSCGFENGKADGFIDNELSFELCDHVTLFIMHVLKKDDENFKKYVNDIIPRCLKNQYILDYLFEKGLIIKNPDQSISCSNFGKLIIRLYLYPVSGVLLRHKLESGNIYSFDTIIKESFEILKAESRLKDDKMYLPILEWINETPIDDIIEKYNIMAGDLYQVRDNIERIVIFMGIIATHLSEVEDNLRENLLKVAKMAEILRIRIRHGIREDLFDLILGLKHVGRIRGRILHEAGYQTALQVKKENPYILHYKTGLGLVICKKIVSHE